MAKWLSQTIKSIFPSFHKLYFHAALVDLICFSWSHRQRLKRTLHPKGSLLHRGFNQMIEVRQTKGAGCRYMEGVQIGLNSLKRVWQNELWNNELVLSHHRRFSSLSWMSPHAAGSPGRENHPTQIWHRQLECDDNRRNNMPAFTSSMQIWAVPGLNAVPMLDAGCGPGCRDMGRVGVRGGHDWKLSCTQPALKERMGKRMRSQQFISSWFLKIFLYRCIFPADSKNILVFLQRVLHPVFLNSLVLSFVLSIVLTVIS